MKHGVTILGYPNVPGRLATNASALYAKNLLNFVQLFVADGAINIDWEDDIIKGVGLTRDGKVVHPNFAAAEPEPAPEPEPVEAEADAPAANGAVPETTPAENGSDETQ